jgi:hypothetical protein
MNYFLNLGIIIIMCSLYKLNFRSSDGGQTDHRALNRGEIPGMDLFCFVTASITARRFV